MLGLGLGQYLPYVIYMVFFPIALIALFRRSEIGILFIAFFLPIYALLNKTLKSELPLAKDIIDILVISMLVGWLLQKKKYEGQPISNPPLLVPIILFMAYSFFNFMQGASTLGTDLLSEASMERLAVWKNYMIMPLLYLLAYYNLRDRKWKYALFILLAISFLVMDIKFRQTFQWFARTHYTNDMRISGTLGFLGPNEWGSFHTIYTLFLIGLFMIDKHVWRRVAYAVLIGGSIYCLMYSFSRGAYVGLIAGLFVIAFVKSRKLLIPLIVFLVIWKSVVPISVVERIEGTFVDQGNLEQVAGADVVSVGGTEISTTGRKQLWDQALNYFSQSPVTGVGFRTFENLTGWDTHNVYIKFLAEQGIIGLSLYLWLYFLALRSGWQLYKTADEQLVKAFGFAFLCAVVGSMLVNYFGDRWTYLQIGGLYWIFWALADQEYSILKAKEATASLEVTTGTTANA